MTSHSVLSPLTRILLAVLLVTTICGYALIPLDRSLPVHWGLSGAPDRFAPAAIALALPALLALVVVALGAVLRLPRFRGDLDASRHVMSVALSSVVALALALSLATLALGLGLDVDMPRLIALMVGLQILCLGNALPKSRPNRLAGVRLPQIMSDPRIWRVTQLWTGRLMMLSGLVLVGAALLSPGPTTLIVLIVAAVVIPAFAGILIGTAMARRA
ncbi:Uncharacterized membrane protein [Devosia enhydra]|uniref:Uncharacterized membrane protein n=1 Tax=Devosia enhydra TaxID=665118 RepID=A0A1K2HVA9_9HYPH|nr:SdpI family protein [Devosia enhydra]SFZ82644.1 Uncharacterized membrane protein [Devosia enhydra]